MKKSEILQKVLDKMLTELRALKSVLREDEWEYMAYKFSSFEEYLRGKIVFEKAQEKTRRPSNEVLYD